MIKRSDKLLLHSLKTDFTVTLYDSIYKVGKVGPTL